MPCTGLVREGGPEKQRDELEQIGELPLIAPWSSPSSRIEMLKKLIEPLKLCEQRLKGRGVSRPELVSNELNDFATGLLEGLLV